VALLFTLLSSACGGGSPFDSGTVPSASANPGTAGGGLVPDAGALVGTWESVWVVELATDIQRITTRWHFRGIGTCSREVATFSMLADQTLVTVRRCTFRLDGTFLYVRYDDALEDVRFGYSNVNFDPRRLLLGGIEFVRVD
jgi:hypothetical protein